MAFQDMDADGRHDSGEPVLSEDVVPSDVTLIASPSLEMSRKIVFKHDGFAYDGNAAQVLTAVVRACIDTDRIEDNARDISVALGGRVATSRANPGIPCAAPGDL